MLIHFDLTHTVHYNDLCRLVVKNNWRLCQSRYVSNICTIRQQLCKKALTDAYVSVLATKKRRISNKIYLKVIFRRLIPFAKLCGMEMNEVEKIFENARYPIQYIA